MKTFRIVLADDHALIRQGIKKLIEEDEELRVVGEVGDGLELLDFLKENSADLVVLDISMPNLRGIEAISEVHKIDPDIKILILTMHKNEQYLCSSMQAGAHGYLLKEDSDMELLPAIHQVLAGDIFITPVFAGDFAGDIMNSCSQLNKKTDDPLSTRERQILKLVAEGVTNKEIADMLAISRRTVEHHRANIMKKLAIKSTAELVQYAIQKGYVQPVTAG